MGRPVPARMVTVKLGPDRHPCRPAGVASGALKGQNNCWVGINGWYLGFLPQASAWIYHTCLLAIKKKKKKKKTWKWWNLGILESCWWERLIQILYVNHLYLWPKGSQVRRKGSVHFQESVTVFFSPLPPLFFSFFNWSITALHSSVSFFCTGNWVSCVYISLVGAPPPSVPLPSRSSRSTELSSLHSAAASHSRSVLHRPGCVCQSHLLSSSHSPPASHYRKGRWKQEIAVRSYSFMNGYLFGPRVFIEHRAGPLAHCPVASAYISDQNRKVVKR